MHGVGVDTTQRILGIERYRADVGGAGRDIGDHHQLPCQRGSPLRQRLGVLRGPHHIRKMIVGKALPGPHVVDEHGAMPVNGDDDIPRRESAGTTGVLGG